MLKVCGARTSTDVDLVGDAGADFVGLWRGVPGGHAELSQEGVAELAAVARRHSTLTPVLVTLLDTVGEVLEALAGTGVRWVQLHGYAPPSVVRSFKAVPGLHIIKVLHLRPGGCDERGLVAGYQRAGTDVFLVDSTGPDGRLGSTGRPVDPAVLQRAVAGLQRPFLVGGGITVETAGGLADVVQHPRYLGVDVDTGARDATGALDPAAVIALAAACDVPGRLGPLT